LVYFSSAETVASAEWNTCAAPFTTKLAAGNVSPAFPAATEWIERRYRHRIAGTLTPANRTAAFPNLSALPERFRINI